MADTINSETNEKPIDFLNKKKILDSIYLDPPSTNKPLNQTTSLKDKAVGMTTSYHFSQSCQTRNCTVFKFISQLCTEGIFYPNCKIARITPIYKRGAKEEMNSYRPISILTCFSKIIDKILFVRFSSFFKKHNVMYENQYGFQSNIFTSHAMLDIVTSSYNNIDDYSYTGLAFVDLKKSI